MQLNNSVRIPGRGSNALFGCIFRIGTRLANNIIVRNNTSERNDINGFNDRRTVR
jgi:hypothetical protein